MFDFDAGKLLVIGIVALVVIGPKDLPRVLRQVGQVISKLRRMAGEFQSQFMDAMREAEIDDIRKDVEKAAEGARMSLDFNPISDVKRELSDALSDRPAMPAGAPQLDLDVPKFGGLENELSGAAPVAEPDEKPVDPVALYHSQNDIHQSPALDPLPAAPATPVDAAPIAPVLVEAIAPVVAPALEPDAEPVPLSRKTGSA
jgi:Tat protein translocase TatB subunit